jgi:uridine kinase
VLSGLETEATKESKRACHHLYQTSLCFQGLVNFLEYHRVVIPGYTYLQEEVVGKAMTNEQKRLEKIIVEGLPILRC